MATATRLVGDLARKIADLTDQAIREHLGPDSTFEQRQDLASAVTADGLWFRSDRDLHDAITTAHDVEVEGRRYHRLEQASSATYYGRWGSHHIEESLYREVGVHNGPTIKPIELRFGIIEHMTPDMTRVVGELSAEHSSRGVERAGTPHDGSGATQPSLPRETNNRDGYRDRRRDRSVRADHTRRGARTGGRGFDELRDGPHGGADERVGRR